MKNDMELTNGEFRELAALYYTVSGNRGVPVSRAIMNHFPYLERQSLLDKELVEIHYSQSLNRLFVTEKGEAALKEEPTRALRAIESMGSFYESSSRATGYLHQGAKEMMGCLAQCQLPEFLSHENTWMRSYAEERLRATQNEK